MSRLVHNRLSEETYDHLRERILNLEIPLGTRLKPAVLARDLGVSTTPIKLALARLENDGLVEQSRRRGIYVKVPSRQDVENLFDIRKALEMLAIEKATLLFEDCELEEFLKELDKAEGEASTGNGKESTFEIDRRIHQRCIDIQPNELIRMFMKQIQNREMLYRKMGANAIDASTRLRSIEKHKAIVRAMAARDPKRAALEMGEHIEDNRKSFPYPNDRSEELDGAGRRAVMDNR